jgi:hypothetical protein
LNLNLRETLKLQIIKTNGSTGKDEFTGPIGWNYTTAYILTVK